MSASDPSSFDGGVGADRFDDDRINAPRDPAHIGIFLVAIALLLGGGLWIYNAAGELFADTGPRVAPIRGVALSPVAVQRPAQTPVAVATEAPAPAVITQAGLTARPAPTAIVTAEPAINQFKIQPMTPPTVIAGAPPRAATAAAAAPSPAPATPVAAANKPFYFKVGNTDGAGVYLRRTPRLADRMIAWPDNTVMESLGEQATGDRMTWEKVKDPRGNVGYVPVQWLVRVEGSPTAADTGRR